MYDKFIDYLKQFVSPDERQLDGFLKEISRVSIAKNEYLLRIGEVCEKVYFVNSGILRHFHINPEENIEATVWFSMEGDLLMDVQSFLTQKPGLNHIIALTDAELFSMPYHKLQELYLREAIWERFGRLTVEKYLLGQMERNYGLLFHPAKKRYIDFTEKYAAILPHIPLHQIASFIGVSFETLSRIRSKKM